ncbi:hypothetical protein [Prosthecobacter dejongeii]|uniref:Uncharacterized protein n=1 Tax=Prosthecobacter dejongeii TaxID=48465 RepID=A0A7W7YMN0_9BACT|nr:hypothetical protein [Prosthecobacter dejongeii]MBB5038787.1 hypothetical protein [Prosthecobacter dejongeii]
MPLARSILLIFALLAQALPVAALGRGAEMETCSMSCCANVRQMQVSDCGCVEAPVSSSKPTPASPAPASSRDLLSQPQWVLLSEALELSTAASAHTLPAASRLHLEAPALTQPHVRLPVLFCSFLT